MYSFLNNFHKRMTQVAIHRFLNEKAVIKEGLRQGDFSHSQALNLLMQLLCFIMEKSLLEQSCTTKDMEAFLMITMSEMPMTDTTISDIDASNNQEIENIDYEGLTRYLVRDALQNKGKPYYFETYDFNSKKEIKIPVRLIEDNILKRDGEEVFSYNLTTQGYEFLFGTLEVEESLQMNFEQLKLQYAIKKRNFGSAKESADNLFALNRKQIQKISEYIVRIKEDVGTFKSEDYENTYRGTFDTLNEQKEKHEELYKLITKTKEQYLEQGYTDDDNKKMMEDIKNIDYIKSRLQQLLGEQIKLFNEQQTLVEVYEEAINNVLYIGFENRLNIEKDILEPFEANTIAIEGLAEILRPLFLPHVNKQFNFAKAYGEQKIEVDDGIEVEEEFFLEKGENTNLAILKEHIDFVQRQYKDILERLLTVIFDANANEVKLSEIFQKTEDIDVLRNVLIRLHIDRVFDLKAIGSESKEYIYEPEEDFDFGYSYLNVIHANENLKKLQVLSCNTGKDIITIYSTREKKYLRCNELIFTSKEG